MKNSRHAFTLVELLVVMIAIGILAGISMAALGAVQRTAAEVRTRTTIMKIHAILMEKYASYADRRIPVELDMTKLTSKQAAEKRLMALRELQTIEMPDHWAEIKEPKLGLINPNENSSYQRMKAALGSRDFTNDGNVMFSAELLYLIVMAQPGAADVFSGAEVGDTNNNGLKEFLDGWGRPIFYIRWPVGFLPENGAITDLQTGNPTMDHDPFDVFKVEANAYAVYPLIYSAGADGIRGLMPPDPSKGPSPDWKGDVGAPGTGTKGQGAAGNKVGNASPSYDNITNHVLN